MKSVTSRRSFVALGSGIAIAGIAAASHWRPASSVAQIDHSSPEADASPMAMGGTAAAYMTITNTGTADDLLTGGSTQSAEVIEIHEMKMEGDVMMMSPLPDGLIIPTGGSVVLDPDGYHVMLIGLKQDLKANTSYLLRLEFAMAGTIELEVPVYSSIDSFEAAQEEDSGEPVVHGSLEITGVWTRMAPMLPAGSPMAMPDGSPEATPGM